MRWLTVLLLCLGFFGVSWAMEAGGRAHPVPFEDEEARWGYRDAKGRTVIAARYFLASEFNRHGIAFVQDGGQWSAIDVTGKVLFHPYNFDNGPDYFEEGLARFVEDGRMGFYNERGEKVIAAQFDYVHPFSEGKAQACMGCREEPTPDEHRVVVGGKWGVIDRTGQWIKPPH